MNRGRQIIKRDPKATRERIIKAAISIFSQGDFNEATMRDIAHKSGISQANIYQHFESKESLLFSIITDEIKRMKIDMEQHLSGIRGTYNKLRKFTWVYLNMREQNRQTTWLEYMVLSTKAWTEPPGVWDLTMEITYIFRDILIEGKRNGEVRPDVDIRVLGHMYFGGLRNIIAFWLLGKQFKSLTDEASDSLTEIIWEAVKTPPPSIQCPLLTNKKLITTLGTIAANKKVA